MKDVQRKPITVKTTSVVLKNVGKKSSKVPIKPFLRKAKTHPRMTKISETATFPALSALKGLNSVQLGAQSGEAILRSKRQEMVNCVVKGQQHTQGANKERKTATCEHDDKLRAMVQAVDQLCSRIDDIKYICQGSAVTASTKATAVTNGAIATATINGSIGNDKIGALQGLQAAVDRTCRRIDNRMSNRKDSEGNDNTSKATTTADHTTGATATETIKEFGWAELVESDIMMERRRNRTPWFDSNNPLESKGWSSPQFVHSVDENDKVIVNSGNNLQGKTINGNTNNLRATAASRPSMENRDRFKLQCPWHPARHKSRQTINFTHREITKHIAPTQTPLGGASANEPWNQVSLLSS